MVNCNPTLDSVAQAGGEWYCGAVMQGKTIQTHDERGILGNSPWSIQGVPGPLVSFPGGRYRKNEVQNWQYTG